MTSDLPDEARDGRLVITDVQTQRRRAVRRSIFINGEFAFGISEENYVRFALFKGREITSEYLDEVRSAEETFQARQVAMRFVGHRMRSVQEVERKLAEREFPPKVIAATVDFLREYRMIDDEAFARAYVNDQLLKRPVGRRRLRTELRKKGIEEADEALDQVIDDDAELRNATAAAERRLATLRQDDPRKRDRTLSNFLASRGFGWETIGRVLREIRAGGDGNSESETRN